ncbi:hypothetical protein RND81_09G083000 [Saponaria officinalis]|uniref:Alpha/beta hydrolase fold-3 domain-containing protein n=1 Tax=Saponaria officinalis TaxID=3572 RepID=A0AAW1II93_SAPOF
MGRVFLGGDSAGGNMSHDMLVRAGRAGLLIPTNRIEGVVLVHPFFTVGQSVKLMDILSGGKMAMTDPKLNPMGDPDRMRREVVCERMLVCVDKDDMLKGCGVAYCEALKGSGWEGKVELLETNGGGHVFHLWDQKLEKSHEFLEVIASFINQ